ncbi:excitatory amino acid transporter 3-like [Morone saxatilis]|uniref:excitatory amino acid transporter 3-like n=1 Tax=Morone saxatilis TaxID=34816 RepID=UPI0015E2577D|nr:excitatory amino acid transporter 3-like [Morone saxatilis]
MENNTSEEESQPSASRMRRCWNKIMRNKFLASSLTAVVLGIVLGFVLKICVHMTELHQLYIGFPGELLMRMLQAVTIPLIVTSVITGVSGLSVKTSKRIGLRAVIYFVSTTLLSVCTGLILVLLIKPGIAYAVKKDDDEYEQAFSTIDALLDLIRNMVPDNLILACYRQLLVLLQNLTEMQVVGSYVEGTNILGLIVWSFILGVILNRMGESGQALMEFLTILNEATKCVVDLILGYLPIGVLFLIASHVVEVHDWETTFKLGKFMVVVITGLIIHGTITLPLMYLLITRRNPIAAIKGFSPALLTALVISSSSATLPLTLQCCEERLKFDKRITRFMLPIGTNINMDGTALYEVVAVVFIAQLNHIELNLSQLITLSVTSTVSSIGAAGTPATGAVTTILVLSAIGLPAKEATILVVIEWLLDRCNTVVNVMGDCIGVAIIHQVSKNELAEMDEQVQEMTRMHGSDDESLSPDEIQVHIRSQDSNKDILYILSESPPSDGDGEEHNEGQFSEDSCRGFLYSQLEYPPIPGQDVQVVLAQTEPREP